MRLHSDRILRKQQGASRKKRLETQILLVLLENKYILICNGLLRVCAKFPLNWYQLSYIIGKNVSMFTFFIPLPRVGVISSRP